MKQKNPSEAPRDSALETFAERINASMQKIPTDGERELAGAYLEGVAQGILLSLFVKKTA